MAIIAVTPIVLKDCIVSIDGNDYAAAINSVVFTPTASTVTFKGLKKGAVFTDVAEATWACALSFAQDWAEEESLSNYLHENEGDIVDAVFRPRSGSGPSVEAEIVITPGAIGGAVDATAVATVNLGVQGKPAVVPAAP